MARRVRFQTARLKSVVRSKLPVRLRKSLKRAGVLSKTRFGNVAVEKREILQDGPQDLIRWLLRERVRGVPGLDKNKRLYPLLSGRENVFLFVPPKLNGVGVYLPKDETLSNLALLHAWVRETNNPAVVRARRFRKFFFVNKKGELEFTNDSNQALKVFVPPIPKPLSGRYERAFSFFGKAPPLVFSHPDKPKMLYLLASGKNAVVIATVSKNSKGVFSMDFENEPGLASKNNFVKTRARLV